MILYFSGTGNSQYAAERLGQAIKEPAVDLFEKIRNRDYSALFSDSPWIVVSPIYAWRIPRLVQNWLKQTELRGCSDIYFAVTCGSEIGNASHYLRRLCASKGLRYRGIFPIVMPDNYLVLFPSPSPEEAIEIIRRAAPSIDEAASYIRRNVPFPEPAISLKDKFISGIVNSLFYTFFVRSKKFRVSSSCISCGRCAKLCPLGNIRMKEGRPVWGDDCTHCMACICRCPVNAIEYGSRTEGKTRYRFPKQPEQ
ncbi:MAG: EFR1 family ferrodoxin [Lacrimispora saccharolytica]